MTPRSHERRVLTMPRSEWIAALSATTALMRQKTSLPVLSHVQIEPRGDHAIFTATDLDATLRLRVPADAPDPLPLLLPGRQLASVLACYPNAPIALTAHGDRAAVQAGRARYECATFPTNEFPQTPQLTGAPILTVAGAVLARAISRVQTHASQEASRPILNGLLLECGPAGVALVATNGHTLARAPISATPQPERQHLFPAVHAAIIAKLFAEAETVEVRADAMTIQFETPTAALTVRQIEGPYPPYVQILPTSATRSATVDTAEWATAIKRVLAAQRADEFRLVLTWQPASLHLAVKSAETGVADDEISVVFEGDAPFKIGMNGRYLLRALDSLPGDSVRVEMNGAERAIKLTPAGDDADPRGVTLALLMPLRLFEED